MIEFLSNLRCLFTKCSVRVYITKGDASKSIYNKNVRMSI